MFEQKDDDVFIGKVTFEPLPKGMVVPQDASFGLDDDVMQELMDEMYRENILDHGMNPRNEGIIEDATVDHEVNNPLCGDQLRLTLQIDDNSVITAIGWQGNGCAISQASASMLGEEIIGKTIEDVKSLTPDDVYEMLGISISQNRVKCALLGLKALHVSLHGLDFWRELEDADED